MADFVCTTCGGRSAMSQKFAHLGDQSGTCEKCADEARENAPSHGPFAPIANCPCCPQPANRRLGERDLVFAFLSGVTSVECAVPLDQALCEHHWRLATGAMGALRGRES